MKFKHIDSIRGVAILMVIMVHTSHVVNGLDSWSTLFTSYCQMGVQLFFVASAFTLCLSNSKRENETQPLRKYAIRRFFRIAPLYYLGIIIYFLIEVLHLFRSTKTWIIPDNYAPLNVLANIFFLHGTYPPANNCVVPGGWSIGTEMLFYVLFPLLYNVLSKRSNLQMKYVLWVMLSILILSQITIATLHFIIGLTLANNSFLYYHLINQIPVFAMGMGYFMIEKNGWLKHHWKYDMMSCITLTSMALFLWQLHIDYLFTIIPIVSGLSFIFLIELFKKVNQLNVSLLSRIGTVSYSMYIFHFIFAWEIAKLLAPKLVELFNAPMALIILYILSVAGSFGIALISEKYIEKTFIEKGRLLTNKL